MQTHDSKICYFKMKRMQNDFQVRLETENVSCYPIWQTINNITLHYILLNTQKYVKQKLDNDPLCINTPLLTILLPRQTQKFYATKQTIVIIVSLLSSSSSFAKSMNMKHENSPKRWRRQTFIIRRHDFLILFQNLCKCFHFSLSPHHTTYNYIVPPPKPQQHLNEILNHKPVTYHFISLLLLYFSADWLKPSWNFVLIWKCTVTAWCQSQTFSMVLIFPSLQYS